MLREQVPDLSEEALAAALKAPASASSSQLSQLSQLAAPRPAAGEVDLPAAAPILNGAPISKQTISVPIPFPTQSLDTLHLEDHTAHSPVPASEDSPRRALSNEESGGGIVIHEKYHDLFITPPVPPSAHETVGDDDAQSINTPHSAHSSPQPTATVDDESFYPEDEAGVSV